jgi:transcriptional regulator with XRE-family HTH domain
MKVRQETVKEDKAAGLGDIDGFLAKFGRRLREKRTLLRLTQVEIANALSERDISVTQSYLSLIESGERREPSMRIVLALAALLDISIDELLRDSE